MKREAASGGNAVRFDRRGCRLYVRPPVGDLDELRNAEAPYYYVGRAFEGDEVSFISRYRDHQANIIYGTCHADDDEGCSPPLAIQHSFCLGVLTISIFGNRGKAQRAAEALRPFSQGARARAKRPAIVFDRGVSC